MLHVPNVWCVIASSQSTTAAKPLREDLREVPDMALLKVSTLARMYYRSASAKLQLV